MNAESAMFHGFILPGKAWDFAIAHFKNPVLIIWHGYSHEYSMQDYKFTSPGHLIGRIGSIILMNAGKYCQNWDGIQDCVDVPAGFMGSSMTWRVFPGLGEESFSLWRRMCVYRPDEIRIFLPSIAEISASMRE